MHDHDHDHDHESHGHDHRHHGHGHHSGRGRTELRWVLFLSSTYLVAEVIGAYWSGSLALLADAGHMLIDVLAVVLGLFALWIAQKPPTPEKTYGFYRAEILAALVNGATLVAIACWILVEAWHRLGQPPEIQGPMMFLVASGGLLINGIQLLLLHRKSNDTLNMRGVWLHLVTDTLGSVAAVTAAGLVWAFGWTLADPVISILIAVLILWGSWKLLSECVNVLLEGVPKGIQVAHVEETMKGCPDVADVHDLHVWMVSSGMTALSAHVRLRASADPGTALAQISRLVRERFKIPHVTIQVEPAQFDRADCNTSH